MTTTRIFGAALGLALGIAASTANAYCAMHAPDGTRSVIGANECQFMGSEEDFANFGAEACEGLPMINFADWSDTVIAVELDAPGSVTLFAHVVQDEEQVVWSSETAGRWDIPTDHFMYMAANVLICRQ